MVVEILYQKVADDIKKNILSGVYELDSLIPTENDLEKNTPSVKSRFEKPLNN
jgi:Transcriptional regulators